MPSIRTSIQLKILLLLLAIGLPPLLLVGYLGLAGLAGAQQTAINKGTAALRSQAEAALAQRAQDKARLYDAALAGAQQQVESVARYAETLRADPSPLPRDEPLWIAPGGPSAEGYARHARDVAYARSVIPLLQEVVGSNGLFNLGYLALDEGGLIAFDNAAVIDILTSIAPFDPRLRPWYVQARSRGRTIWTDAYVDANSKQLTTTCATPIYDESGRFIGVVGFDLLLPTIQEDLLTLDIGEGGYAFLINGVGDVVVRPDLTAEGRAWSERVLPPRLTDSSVEELRAAADRMLAREQGVVSLTLDGTPSYLAYAPISTAGWSVGMVVPAESVTRPAIETGQQIAAAQDELRLQLNLLLVLVAIGVGLVGALASLSFTRRIRALREGAALVASGRFDQRLPAAGRDEIGQLVDVFNSMTSSLQEKIAELEENAQQLATLNEVSNEFKRILDLQALLEAIAHATCDRFGFDRSVIYLLEDDHLRAASASFGEGRDEEARRFLAIANTRPLRADSPTVEADVVRSGKAVIVNDPWNHPRVDQVKQEASASTSYVQVPIFGRRDRVIGLISADHFSSESPVQPQDAARLLTFASMVGLTIENVRLYNDLERQVAERTVELRGALERAQVADRRKSDFLASVSHELRTPLNAIIGFSTVLLDNIDGPLTPHQREDVQSINRNGRFLLHLINELLDLAKIEAGHLTLERAPLNLAHLASEVVDTLQNMARSRKLVLKAAVPRALPPVDADADRVRQILFNLLSNALKFTEKGYVIVGAQPYDELDDEGRLRSYIAVSVRDTGIGIPADQIDRIFEEFSQGHGRRSRLSGTGLGLAIVRRIVEAHGGRIWVTSTPGSGSAFTFTLPVQGVEAGGPPALPDANLVREG